MRLLPHGQHPHLRFAFLPLHYRPHTRLSPRHCVCVLKTHTIVLSPINDINVTFVTFLVVVNYYLLLWVPTLTLFPVVPFHTYLTFGSHLFWTHYTTTAHYTVTPFWLPRTRNTRWFTCLRVQFGLVRSYILHVHTVAKKLYTAYPPTAAARFTAYCYCHCTTTLPVGSRSVWFMDCWLVVGCCDLDRLVGRSRTISALPGFILHS